MEDISQYSLFIFR